MAFNKKLRAFVRYDGKNRVVAGSLILQPHKPKDGKWKELPVYKCCCLPPVYGEDYINTGVTEVPGGLIFGIETNPFTNPTLQVAIISCSSGLPLEITTIVGNVYGYFVPDVILSQGCALGFRRVCTNSKSEWII